MTHPPEPDETDRTISSTGPTRAIGPKSPLKSDSTEPGMPPEINQAPADARVGKYIRVSRLGAGGMGEVWKAWDTELNRWVALKILKGTEEEELFRFRREAQTSARLVHPNIAAVFEAQERYIAMQFVDGMTLDEYPHDGLRALVGFVRQAALAVHHAHRNGIIHRDIKPGNIMVTRQAEPHVYVMDFGLAKSTGVASSVSVSGIVLGTPGYMSPEQARGKTDLMGPATDVYSLGATLYTLLAHRPPFKNDNVYEVLREIVEEEPLPVRRRNPRVDLDLETLVMKCLDKNPSNRYASAADLADELDRWLRGDPILARPVSTVALILRSARRHKGLTIASGALALVILLSGVALLVQDRSATRRGAAMQHLSMLWSTITERKRELRLLKIAPETARADLLKAVTAVDSHIRQWPGEPQGYYVRARGHLYLGNLEDAEADLMTALDRHPDFRPGWSLLGMVKVEQYYRMFFGSLQTPNQKQQNARPFLVEANAAFDKGWRTGKEQEESQRWGLAWTREDEVMERLARVQRLSGDPQRWPEAKALLEQGVSEFRSEEYAHRLAISGFPGVEKDKWLALALEWAPGFDKALLSRGLMRVFLGDYTGALVDFDLALRIRGDSLELLTNRGYARKSLGDLQGALEDHNRALALRKDYGIALLHRGDIRRMLKDFAGALEDVQRAIDIERGDPECFHFRGRIRHDQGDLAGALEDFKRSMGSQSEDPVRLFELGLLRQEMGMIKAAEEDFTRVVEMKPDYVLAWANRGATRGVLGDVKGAFSDFTRALELNPKHVQTLLNRGTLWQRSGRPDEALSDYDRAIQLDSKNANAYASRAFCHHARRSLEAAMADFSTSIALDPTDARTFAGRAGVKRDLKDYSAALEDLDRALVLDPKLPEAYAIRGAIRMIQGDVTMGIADFEAALQHAPPGWPMRPQVEHWLKVARGQEE